jgi:PAS domain S-box-containing protein
VLVLGPTAGARNGRGGPAGLIDRIVPVVLALLAVALVAYNLVVCQRARVGLVGDPAASYDSLIHLVVLDVGAFLVGLVAVWFWRGRGRGAAPVPVTEPAEPARELTALQAVWDNAFDAVLNFDARGRVRAVNRAASALFKHPVDEMWGEPIHRFLSCGTAGERGVFEPAALEAVTDSEAVCGDGELLSVKYVLSRAGAGKDSLYTAVIRDLSERKKAEERLQTFREGLEVTNRRLEEANAQLEEVSRLKSEFLANTSHELRTPLNGMIGFLQLVLDGMCDSPEEERDFLQQALQCSRHLLGLINDVLDIAKIEAGKLSLEIEAVDVRALFGEVYTLTHVQADQKGLALKFDVPEHCTHAVRGDFGKIKQVLVNLLGNSLKFTSKGSITVRATERADFGHYIFEVIDTGIGVPEDRQKVIFEKFTQGDGSTTRKYGGTGLGLAICRSLVELMGGIINVESEGPGKGTRMFFSLPLWRPTAEEAQPVDSHVPERIEGPAGGPLVLIVEDDQVFRKFLSALLQRNGYRTVEAGHAEGGWVLVRRLHPSVVVLDYALISAEGASLRTGWDLAERMTTDAGTRHIPLIFVTGFDVMLKDKIKTTALARPPEHLMKPVDGHMLLGKIEELIGSSRGGVIRILMADDDPSVSAYVRKVLPEGRFHIEVANNGEECLHALRMQPRGFDLLLLDLMMPDVSGYDVLRELSVTGVAPELPVLILTNYPDARDDEEKRLLERALVLDVIAKSSVHENPMLLPHIIDWHMQVVQELGPGGTRPKGTVLEAAQKEAA